MSDQELAALPAVDDSDVADARTGGIRALLARAKVPLIIGTIVLAECLAAYFFLPAAAESAAVAAATTDPVKEALEGEPADSTGEPGDEAGPTANEYVEVELGKFSVMAFHPNTTNSTLVIDFHLFGALKQSNQADFMALFEANENRFRDEIIMTIRSAELAELTDPGLGLIKRKFLATTNRMLGKPLLQAVVFSDFSFIEQ